MTIVTRGDHYYLKKGVVPIDFVVEHVVQHRDMEKTCARFRLEPEDVFEALEFWGNLHPITQNSFLLLENAGDVDTVQIDTTGTSAEVWIELVSYARMFYPEITELNRLYQQGVRLVTLECYIDIKNQTKDYVRSDLHNLVFKSVCDAIGEPHDIDSVLDMLGVDEYLQLAEEPLEEETHSEA
jgi:hypothetical protein